LEGWDRSGRAKKGFAEPLHAWGKPFQSPEADGKGKSGDIHHEAPNHKKTFYETVKFA
jgi:hypothetical protein